MCIGIQALGTPFGAAALQICNLLDARVELRFPSILWNFNIFAVEYVFNGVGAVRPLCQRIVRESWEAKAMMSPVAMWGSNKKAWHM